MSSSVSGISNYSSPSDNFKEENSSLSTEKIERPPLTRGAPVSSEVKIPIRSIESVRDSGAIRKLFGEKHNSTLPQQTEVIQGDHIAIVPIREKKQIEHFQKEAAKKILKIKQEADSKLNELTILGKGSEFLVMDVCNERAKAIEEVKKQEEEQIEKLLKSRKEYDCHNDQGMKLEFFPRVEQSHFDDLIKDYEEILSDIDKEEEKAIREVEKKIESNPKVALRMKGDAGFLRADVEEEKRKEINKIKQKARDDRNLLMMVATRDFEPYQKDYFNRILDRYKVTLESNTATASFFPKKNNGKNDFELLESEIETSFQRQEKIFDDFAEVNKKEAVTFSEDISDLIEAIQDEEGYRLHLLQECVEDSITQNLDQLEKIEETLKKHDNLPPEESIKYSLQLEKDRTNYFVAEAISTDLAQHKTQGAMQWLKKEIQEIDRKLEGMKNELRKFQERKQQEIKDWNSNNDAESQQLATISSYEDLKKNLEQAHQAYEGIADDEGLRIKNILELKYQIATFRAAVAMKQRPDHSDQIIKNWEEVTRLSNRQLSIRSHLPLIRYSDNHSEVSEETNTSIIKERQFSSMSLSSHVAPLEKSFSIRNQNLEGIYTQLQREVSKLWDKSHTNEVSHFHEASHLEASMPSSEPLVDSKNQLETYGLDILLKLADLHKLYGDHALLLGRRGEIEIDPLSYNKNPQKVLEGLQLLRLVVFRNYGAKGTFRFDQQFGTALKLRNPLTVGELIDFIDRIEKEEPHLKGYYLSSAQSLQELIVSGSQDEHDAKIVKVEPSSFTFNQQENLKEESLSDLQEKKATLEAVKKTVKDFLKNLPSEKQEQSLQRFVIKFENKKEEGKQGLPLTVKNLRSFLTAEIERHQADYTGEDITAALFDTMSIDFVYTGLLKIAGFSMPATLFANFIKSTLSRLGVFQAAKRMANTFFG